MIQQAFFVNSFRVRRTAICTLGDGFLVTFDGPARAIRCAQAIVEAAASLGLTVRAGAHTGEIEETSDDVRGIAVNIAARVVDMAGPGGILATRTVKDLTAGSGLYFEEFGVHQLKGVPNEWQLYQATS